MHFFTRQHRFYAGIDLHARGSNRMSMRAA
jgi:hypothetical protein